MAMKTKSVLKTMDEEKMNRNHAMHMGNTPMMTHERRGNTPMHKAPRFGHGKG